MTMRLSLYCCLALIGYTPIAAAQTSFQETFANNTNGWMYYANDSADVSVEKGFLSIVNKRNSGTEYYITPFRLKEKSEVKNFSISATLTALENPNNYNNGIYLDVDTQVYQMYTSYDKSVKVTMKRRGKERENLIPWTDGDYINAGAVPNVLKIVKEGTTISFYVNDHFVCKSTTAGKWVKEVDFIVGAQCKTTISNVNLSPNPIVNKYNPIPGSFKGIRKENLGTAVNSKYSELNPIISPDGKVLYVCMGSDHPESLGGQELFYAIKNGDGTWGKLKHMGPPLNNEKSSSVDMVSSDNNTIVLSGNFKDQKTGNYQGAQEYYTTRNAAGEWEYPQPLTLKDFYNDANSYSYSLSPNLKIQISSVQRKNGYGMQDLYVAFSEDGKTFSAPKNMGPVINSEREDICPFLAPDNTTLYYSSYARAGFGSADIFVTRRLDDSWTNWSEPQNLGPAINTDEWDGYFTIDAAGEYAYFSTGKDAIGKDGNPDIFKIKLPEAAKPIPSVLIYGKVLNKKTNEPIATSVDYSDLVKNESLGIASSSPVDGTYKIVLPRGKAYQFLAEKDGFYSLSENIDIKNLDKYQEIERNLYLSPIEVGATARLNNIFFETNKATLKEESFSELNRLADLLTKTASIKIEVSGHTDATGTDAVNLPLSANRAKAVSDYLVSKGIAANRLLSKGYGKTKPMASNDTEEGKQLNRRVEFTITAK